MLESASRDVDLRLEGIVPRLLDSNGPRAGLERTCRYRRAAGEMVDSSEVGLVAVGEGDGGVNQRASSFSTLMSSVTADAW